MVILTVSGVPEYAPKKEHLEIFCKAIETVVGENIHIILRIHQAIKGKPTQFYEMTLRGKDHIVENIAVPQFLLPDAVDEKIVAAHISPKAFFQPNTKQALRLYEVALHMASLEPHMVFWDLYCGIGLFGILAAHKVSKVIAIELDPDAAYDAKVNAARFGLENFTIFQGDVGEALKNIGSRQGVLRCDVALVDPPRAGLGIKAIQQILELQPSCLVYVSCNPATQVSDVGLLVQGGYRIEEVAPIDQFPHTPHVENIVRLRRISPSI
jgi:23S rRNA (uracil1939-C5)-methyltransferase